MALGLYMDVHIPEAVTTGLRRRGVDVITSQEHATRQVDDEALLDRASALRRVLGTQDDDFLAIAGKRQAAGQQFVGTIYSHQRGPSIGQLIADLELLSHCARPEELASLVTYLPLT